ncbi:MAG: IPT/TIG domain-containing protein [Gemmatimonadaceae bacterium]|nr:IPT/TIG domain-containing protein [Gloeobacterales cyanobacterium ES-bin-141]
MKLERRHSYLLICVLALVLVRPYTSVRAQNDALVLTDVRLPSAAVGQDYTGRLRAVGGVPPFVWSISSGSLPTGLDLDEDTGTISGIAANTGNVTFSIRVQDSQGRTTDRAYVLAVTRNSFRLQAEPTSQTLTQDGTTSFSLRFDIDQPFNGSINLSLLSDLPAGVRSNFDPVSVSGEADTATSTLSMAAEQVTPVGTYSVRIGASSGSLSQFATLNLIIKAPAPRITSFTPAGGTAGTTVTLRGSGFTGATAVTFNQVRARFTVISAQQIVATLPATATTGPLTVVTPNGPTTSSTSFVVPQYTLTLNPKVIELRAAGDASYAVGFTGRTDRLIDLSVTGLPDAIEPTFTQDYLDSDNPRSTLRLRAAPTLASGDYPFTVYGSIGPVQRSGAATLRLLAPTPVLSALTPQRGGSGSSFGLSGSNFQPGATVEIGDVGAPVAQINPTQIVATVPNTARSGRITLTNPDGQSVVTSTVFLVEPPQIASFAPRSVSSSRGSTLIILGNNFADPLVVQVGDRVLDQVQYVSSTQVRVPIPPGLNPGQVRVTLTNPNGQQAVAPQNLSVTR